MASGVYYDFFYKASPMAFVLPMAAAYLSYYLLYIPLYRKEPARLRSKLLADR